MDIKPLGFMYTLCVIGVQISDAVLTIVNNNPSSEICIIYPSSYWDYTDCLQVFRYYIGHLPRWFNDGYTCSSFRRTPLCTADSTVYAVFKNELVFHSNQSLEVEIYTRKSVVTTTRRATTLYRYSNNDENSEPNKLSNTGLIVTIAIGVVVVCVIVFICCKLAWEKSREREALDSPVRYTQQSIPQTEAQTSRNQAYTDDAPPYSAIMQQQQLPVGEEVINRQIHDPEYQNESSGPTSSESIPENHPLPFDQTGTNPTPDEQDGNQIIPTAPPPDYADIEPPPPYPGY